MRDPLARVAIRYKLALAFGLVAGVSLGAGGLVAWRTSRAVLDSAGQQLGVVWIHRDTTEARKSERRAAESEKLAGIGRLAAGIAHELGTPLGSIVFFAEEVADEIRGGRCMACLEGPKLLALLSQVQRNAYRCKRIGRKLLDFGIDR